jgi:hypothetical protein
MRGLKIYAPFNRCYLRTFEKLNVNVEHGAYIPSEIGVHRMKARATLSNGKTVNKMAAGRCVHIFGPLCI